MFALTLQVSIRCEEDGIALHRGKIFLCVSSWIKCKLQYFLYFYVVRRGNLYICMSGRYLRKSTLYFFKCCVVPVSHDLSITWRLFCLFFAVLLFCVHFYYDEQLMLLFLGLFKLCISLWAVLCLPISHLLEIIDLPLSSECTLLICCFFQFLRDFIFLQVLCRAWLFNNVVARTRALFSFSVQFFLDEELISLFPVFFCKKNSLYVGEDASLSDSHACKKFVQFLVILKSQLQVSRYYSAFLVVSRSCAIYI